MEQVIIDINKYNGLINSEKALNELIKDKDKIVINLKNGDSAFGSFYQYTIFSESEIIRKMNKQISELRNDKNILENALLKEKNKNILLNAFLIKKPFLSKLFELK